MKQTEGEASEETHFSSDGKIQPAIDESTDLGNWSTEIAVVYDLCMFLISLFYEIRGIVIKAKSNHLLTLIVGFGKQCATFLMSNFQAKTFPGRARNVFAALIFQCLDHQPVMRLHFGHMFLAGWEEQGFFLSDTCSQINPDLSLTK